MGAVRASISAVTAEDGPKRRFRSKQERRQIVEETLKPVASVSLVARAHDVNANQVFKWRKLYREGRLDRRSAADTVQSDCAPPKTVWACLKARCKNALKIRLCGTLFEIVQVAGTPVWNLLRTSAPPPAKVVRRWFRVPRFIKLARNPRPKAWSTPENVASVNGTGQARATPVLSWDAKTLFIGIGPPGDIFISTREKVTGPRSSDWSTPDHVPGVNTAVAESPNGISRAARHQQ